MPDQPSSRNNKPAHMPQGSVFCGRVVPLLLIGMGIMMLVLILLAAAVLFGWI